MEKDCVIVGIDWGDEGKGRMVDLITADYDVVVRYQGGGNAGHTVINEYGKFALHLLPLSVILYLNNDKGGNRHAGYSYRAPASGVPVAGL